MLWLHVNGRCGCLCMDSKDSLGLILDVARKGHVRCQCNHDNTSNKSNAALNLNKFSLFVMPPKIETPVPLSKRQSGLKLMP